MNSFRSKIIGAFVVIIIINTLMMALVNGYTARLQLTNLANQSLTTAAQETANLLDAHLNTNAITVNSLAQFPDIVNYLSLSDEQRAGSILEHNVNSLLYDKVSGPASQLSYAEGFDIIDLAGNVILSTDLNEIGQNWLDKDFFSEAIFSNSRSFVYFTSLDSSEKEQGFYYVVSPVFSREFHLVGVLAGRYNAQALQDIIVNSNGIAGQQSFGILLDENDFFLGNGGDANALFTTLNLPELKQKISQNSPQFSFKTDGETYQAAVIHLVSRPWVIVFYQPQKIFLKDVSSLTLNILSTALVSVIGVILLGFLVARWLTTPIVNLTKVAEEVVKGNLNVHAQVENHDEIGLLAETINTMTAKTRAAIETLEQRVNDRTRDLQVSANVSHDITLIATLDKLLPSVVKKTREGFSLYFVSVYLFKPEKNQLVLQASSGGEMAKMQSGDMAYSLNAYPSLIAQAGRERRVVIASNVQTSNVHFPNPYLPFTKSEAAIPLLHKDELIGVLGLQSQKVNGITEKDAQVFLVLASQIAIAVKNAQFYEEQIQTAEQLRSLDKMKMQFLSSMSHELRTPMNAIMNFVEMILIGLVGPVNSEQKELLDQALQSSKHLLHLINDILDISKIQAGQLTLFVEDDINLRNELDTVLNMVKPSIKDKSLKIVEDIDENLPLISADRRRIRQVLLNLLSNAAKFTDVGTITLSVKCQEGHILFAVIDTGPGVLLEAQEAIFEPFIQTINGIKQAEGTGLGLPISRNLVEAHGGKLWLESVPGEGAAFFFTLPTN